MRSHPAYQDETAKIFGERVKMLRRKKEMSMDELSLDLGIAKSNLSKYENGVTAPTLDTARKFANYFCVTIDWLAGGGESEEATATIPQAYVEVARNAISVNISAEQLVDAVEFISKIRK